MDKIWISIAGRDETYQGGNNQQWFDLEPRGCKC